MSLALIAAVMVFAAGLSYGYIAGALLAALPLSSRCSSMARRIAGAAMLAFLIPGTIRSATGSRSSSR